MADNTRNMNTGHINARHIIEEQLHTRVAGEYDVVVAGGGPAGVPAAVSAAKAGARVLLLESAGCLGGVWTAGILTFVFDIEKCGVGYEILERLKARKGYVETDWLHMVDFTYDVESMKLILEELCADNGIDVLLHTRVVAAEVAEDRRLTALITESKSGRQAFRAHAFVDCTGDGDLGAQAGNGFDMGSEDSGALQPATFMGTIVVPSHQAVGRFVSFYEGVPEHGPRTGAFKEYLHSIGIDTSYGAPTLFQVHGNLLAIMINHQYSMNATDAADVTAATIEARAEVNRVVDALSTADGPFRGCHLASTAEHIGIREGRRLHGRYRVTVDDLERGARFDDAVCRVRFNVDVHSTDPKNGKSNSKMGVELKPYDIPLRALVAKDIDGLLMAGRCISGDWLSFASYRVTGEAVSLGEAAGALAAVAARANTAPHEVPWNQVKPLIPERPDHWVTPENSRLSVHR
jgi:hypothetical protein